MNLFVFGSPIEKHISFSLITACHALTIFQTLSLVIPTTAAFLKRLTVKTNLPRSCRLKFNLENSTHRLFSALTAWVAKDTQSLFVTGKTKQKNFVYYNDRFYYYYYYRLTEMFSYANGQLASRNNKAV